MLANGLAHPEGLLIRISLNTASWPGVLPNFREVIKETTTSEETEGHSGRLEIGGEESTRAGIVKILEKWENHEGKGTGSETGLEEGQIEGETMAPKAF